MEESNRFVALDTHKAKISVVVAECGRRGEVRYLGEIPNQPEAVTRVVERLAGKPGRLCFCYEAGPCGSASIAGSRPWGMSA